MMPRYMIAWRIEGTWQVEAKNVEEAQDRFDKAWGCLNGVDWRNGEVSNDEPVRVYVEPRAPQESRR